MLSAGAERVSAVKNEIRILLLEDSPADANLVRRTLDHEGLAYALECVDTEAAFVHQLDKSPPD